MKNDEKRPRINKASRSTGMMLQMSARFCKSLKSAPMGAYRRLSDVRQRKRCFESSLDTTAFPCSLLPIWIFGSSYWPPNWRNLCEKAKLGTQAQIGCSETNQMVLRCLTVSNKTAQTRQLSHSGGRRAIYLALASLTLIRGRARSSLRRWLCSISRLNFSSDIDCRPPVRVLMMALKSRYRWICLEKT